MTNHTPSSVLLIGGYGTVGRRAAHLLRQLHPNLPLTIAGRNPIKASALAADVGNADAVTVDIARPDLGLAADAQFSTVVVLLKDSGLNTMRFAQARKIPYIAFSNYAFEIAPEIALYAQQPARAPIALLGHHLGGVATLAALRFARDFRVVRSVAIGAIFGAEEIAGDTTQSDTDRVADAAPRPLMRKNGRWIWADAEEANRLFTDSTGAEREGQAYPLLDVVSIAATTGAESVRFDAAVRDADASESFHEVVLELSGEQADGRIEHVRYSLRDEDVHQGLSARGLALAIERLLGLTGGTPLSPGLYLPENLLDPGDALSRIQELGAKLVRF
ncbi:hypothetical protein CAI21_09445 [Alkalilimnicola ehrlichii]|uniref:Saccharopine dehydrogenase NADP binding domain-containing protein n=1 Tax=Alkalilimnicola ehrlichii TaxID=351052 RepID=A0A3E0WY27_9GAMM|nr:NAD(P)-dependent oxidoreductase [Alkalilimnicola ehrlichii]RFA29294.1 hypothetical protein CAI21_09445 [Alkalilimnicola ehrlichii]RFA36807.1 hypothetical protein CAL65_09780 [Alkalilimnicola ehrlichii]